MRNVLRPESDWLANPPDLNTLKQRKISGTKAGKAAIRASGLRRSVSRLRCTRALIEAEVSAERTLLQAWTFNTRSKKC